MKKYNYIAFYKPYDVLCQFTTDDDSKTLADFNFPPHVYAAGRLDKDSEGLLLLTDDGIFNQKVANPKAEKSKTYWVQVENIPGLEALKQLEKGVIIQGYQTRPCKARLIEAPLVPPRDPPIRERKSIPTAWLEIEIQEGKNRQVRRMTASIGHPTLRLIRVAIGKLKLDNLQVGQWKFINPSEVL
jgi:23S rRNA pseudouridine2457 synthase